MIKRNIYLEQCKCLIGKPIIKVLVGQRRAGKSVLLRHLCDFIGKNNSVFLDFEQYSVLNKFGDQGDLYDYLKKEINNSTKAIFIDEVQQLSNREKAIVGIRNENPGIDIFLTGSNSKMLSSELTTLLRGRYYEIKVYPFAYSEFLSFYKKSNNKETLYDFLKIGGYSAAYIFDNEIQRKQRIKQMMDSILLRDIIERYKIKEVSLFHEMYLYLISTNTQLFNVSTIQKELQKKGYKTTIPTLQNYLKYLEENYLLYRPELYDLHGKKVFERIKKYYLSDHSLRYYFFSNFDLGFGKILENFVFLEAKKKGYDIWTGKKGEYEIDFILEKDGNTKYLQVSYLLSTPEVTKRELNALEIIRDSWPKYLVTMDDLLLGKSESGIQHIQAWNLDEIL